VYVDEVSVYSLMASRIGALPSEFTESQQVAFKDTSQASLGTGEKSQLKLLMGTSSERSQMNSLQVVKKSSIQTTFRELYSTERDRLLLMPTSDFLDARIPDIRTIGDLVDLSRSRIGDTWAVPVESLTRGGLVELEVRLATDDLYRLSAIFSTLSDIISETPSVFPGVVNSAFREAVAINRVLDRLMAGLIPLKARTVDYSVVHLNEGDFVVHNGLLNQPALKSKAAEPLTLVGVTEAGLYWRDVRRVLFSDETFRVFGRLSADGIRDSWRPVKLTELLAEAVPNLSADLAQSARSGLAAFGSTASSEASADVDAPKQCLIQFANLVAVEAKTSVDAEMARKLDEILISVDEFKDRELRNSALDAAVVVVTGDADQINRERIAELREVALEVSGFDFTGSLVQKPVDDLKWNSSRESLIEAEFVAVYW
jgi:hypothetical protein